jgi:hypothetical protein
MRSASGSNPSGGSAPGFPRELSPKDQHRERCARKQGARSIWVAIATLCIPVHGCDTGTGGAVELSWKLRPASSSLNSKFVDCDSGQRGTNPVAQIRLHWQIGNTADPAGNDGSQAWSCQLNHGVTGFDLAEGTANLWVTPECSNGPASPDTYIAPAIVQRQVSQGDTVSLGAVELVVSVSDCRNDSQREPGVPPQPCICDLAADHTAP